MNVFICALVFGFASLNRKDRLSPHESVCYITLITVHYLYIIIIAFVIKIKSS